MKQDEHKAQVEVMEASRALAPEYPELELLFAIPNGGHRHQNVANMLKAEGVKRGVPDLMLPVPRGGYAGLWIEMKAAKGKVSDPQTWWIERLRAVGYRAEVCFSGPSAVAVLVDYLLGSPSRSRNEDNLDLGASRVDTGDADLLQHATPQSAQEGLGGFFVEFCEGAGHD